MMVDSHSNDYLDDEDNDKLTDEERQKENDEIQEMGKQGLTDDDLPDGRPPNTFS